MPTFSKGANLLKKVPAFSKGAILSKGANLAKILGEIHISLSAALRVTWIKDAAQGSRCGPHF